VKNHLVITALGENRPGLVRELSRVVLECDCGIEDSRIRLLGSEFAAILMVQGNWSSLAKLEVQLKRLEQTLGLAILSKRTEEKQSRMAAVPYTVEVIAMDHPGIVHSLASFFTSRSVSIEDLGTHGYSAPHTGAPMFAVNIIIGIPADMPIAMLREEFMDFCDEFNLDAVLEPIKG
jgi:glycine cleavage system transcriptional repressor